MSIFNKIRNGFLVSALVLGNWANSTASTCPVTIDPGLCDSLQILSDTDWVYSEIHLYLDLSWFPTGCDRQDTACLKRIPDTTQYYTQPDSILKETRTLFETYDLRWPDDLQTRAPVPTEDGRRDTISYQYHRPSVAYLVYATKSTILSIGSEAYVEEIKHWVVPHPLSLSRFKSLSSVLARGLSFNLKGQRIETEQVSGFKIQRLPIGH